MCFDNEHRHLFSRTRRAQVNPVDAIQGNKALTIQESIALSERLTALSAPETVRQAQEIARPLPERDRPQWDRYRDEPRIDRDLDRWDFRGRYGY